MTPADELLIPYMYNTCSILSHYCVANGWRQFLGPDDMINTQTCPSCHEDIPEGVLAVWHLFNADEISKYSQQIQGWKESNTTAIIEDPYIYKDSSPIMDIDLDEPQQIYLANGNIYEEEMQEWNGSTVVLFSHDEKIIQLGDESESASCV